jgi:hypothetical protein
MAASKNGANKMSPLDNLTQNPIRSQAILQIVQEAIANGEPLTLEHVAPKALQFGTSFTPLAQDEFDAAVTMLQQPESAPVRVGNVIMDPEAAQRHAEPDPREENRDEANARLAKLRDELHLARQERMKADDAIQSARGELANAMAAWSHTGAGYTREQLVRDTIRANQQYKLDVKEGRIPPPQSRRGVANSYFDRLGAYGRGDATTYARRSHNPGQPWRGGNRGGMPASMQNAPAKLKGEA